MFLLIPQQLKKLCNAEKNKVLLIIKCYIKLQIQHKTKLLLYVSQNIHSTFKINSKISNDLLPVSHSLLDNSAAQARACKNIKYQKF